MLYFTNVISIIAAVDSKNGIGKKGDLLFKIREDFRRMKSLSSGHPIIMGRKTFESIGKPLPDRTNIIISRNPARYHQLVNDTDNVVACNSLEEAIKIAGKSPGSNEIFIFGGGQIFQEALEKKLVDRLYLTMVEGDYKADTFFPEYSDFGEMESEELTSGKYKLKFITLER